MARQEDQPVAALIAVALGKDDENDERWDAVVALQRRGGDEVFAAAERLIASTNGWERRLGVDILAQGQVAERPLRDRAIPLLLELAAREGDSRVIAALCHAFGHLHDPATIDTVRRWATHPDENVRFGVVHGLSGYDDRQAIATLIQLSADADSDVRD
jgi:HEAT repeat protein